MGLELHAKYINEMQANKVKDFGFRNIGVDCTPCYETGDAKNRERGESRRGKERRGVVVIMGETKKKGVEPS